MTDPEAAEVVRLLLVDDDALVRSALTMVLGGDPGVEVVGEAGDGEEALAACRTTSPDVVLMDLRMPRLDGVAATRRIRAVPGGPQVLVLTTFDADENVLAALRAGAAGFLLKDTPPASILTAVHAVAAGDPVLSPRVTRRLMDRLGATDDPADRRRRDARRRLADLAPREREVAQAVGQGLSNAEIGARLHLSVPTVKGHVSRLLVKLDADNRTQVAILVHDAGRA